MEIKRRITLLLFILCAGSHLTNIYAQVNFPGGNIVLLHDGNFRDPDDIGAMPMCLAILQAAKLSDKLVYMEHSHFLGCNDSIMESEMNESMHEAWERFGPFPNSTYFNYYRQSDNARNEFIRVINSSGKDNPLWVICAGRMESLYRAIAGAKKSKRKNLILVSHSIYNEDYTRNRAPMDSLCTGMVHTWDDIKRDFGKDKITFIESSDREIFTDNPYVLTDQNESNGDFDFKTPVASWEWLREMGPDYSWLLTRNRVRNAFDVSDAGILWFVITGAIDRKNNKKVGCETCGWREVKELLGNFMIK